MAKKMSKAQISKLTKQAKTAENAILALKQSNIGETVRFKGKTITAGGWRDMDVKKDVGAKKYTDGQKDFMRAIKVIEAKLGKVAADLKMTYGSDDIEELANQYYLSELKNFSPEELRQIEQDFNETHGYRIRLEQAVNPFSDIDFLNM